MQVKGNRQTALIRLCAARERARGVKREHDQFVEFNFYAQETVKGNTGEMFLAQQAEKGQKIAPMCICVLDGYIVPRYFAG